MTSYIVKRHRSSHPRTEGTKSIAYQLVSDCCFHSMLRNTQGYVEGVQSWEREGMGDRVYTVVL